MRRPPALALSISILAYAQTRGFKCIVENWKFDQGNGQVEMFELVYDAGGER